MPIEAIQAINTSGWVQGMLDGIWVFPQIVVPPNHPLKNGVFHYN